MAPTPTRGRGEQGIAIMMTALCLIPLMVFAAFGVDLASWYSRISYLQKSADAAALAGTVWMPDLGEATNVACASLARNGIVGNGSSPDCAGGGPFTVDVSGGATSTALRVSVTDPDAQRYFSGVFRGTQSLTRAAEAEYNLPIPLGSPLNYFGGDRTTTNTPAVFSYTVSWPTDYTTRVPHSPNTAGGTACNVGTGAAQNLGRWTAAGVYESANFNTGNPQCQWTVAWAAAAGSATTVPGVDYQVRIPTNGTGCRVFANGASGTVLGRWVNSEFTTDTSGSAAACSWNQVSYVTTSRPAFYNGSNIPPGSSPTNRPCRVSYDTADGWYPTAAGGWSASGAPTTPGTAGFQLCRWSTAVVQNTVTPASNPIAVDRSPGFWAQIEGPDTISTNGDAYSPRCYFSNDCSSVENLQYEAAADVDRGYWYVIRMPGTNSGAINVRIFDANHAQGVVDHMAGDRNLGAGGNFSTQFRMYQLNNPLDFSNRTALGSNVGDQTDGSCHWNVPPATGTGTGTSSPFKGVWRTLCTIGSYTPGDLYLLNVQTSGTAGNGVNGYAIEALAPADPQPAVYAYSDMGMYNVNRCSGAGCTPPPATFYLAEVGPQYAGKTLVVSLYDPGDVQAGDALMTVKMPSAALPKPVQDVDPDDCEYESTADPNPVKSSAQLDPTGAIYSTPQPSDSATSCAVVTATNGARRFNGTWLSIRVSIPSTYTCTLSTAATPVNPETTAGSCWWGIEYTFSNSSQDVTVWSARIEGNPVHLTT